MTVFDVCFWLILLLIGALAFSIESGVATRNRGLVLSSLLVSTITALSMMFVVEDKTRFEYVPTKVKKLELSEADTKKLAEAAARIDMNGGVQSFATKAGFSKSGDGFRECADCPTMIALDRGKVQIGSPLIEKGRDFGESPRKQIEIKTPIAFSKFEVLREEYAAFVKATNHVSDGACYAGAENAREPKKVTWQNPGFEQNGRHPVVCVTLKDAQAYTKWLSELTGETYRLPSQAEWEYAARGGTSTRYAFGDEITDENAQYGKETGTQQAGAYPPNPARLHDMHGSVWELTPDCWTPDLEVVPEDASPVGLVGICSRRVLKGGGWNSEPDKLRSAARGAIAETAASPAVGFRVVREL